jgi:hypothetical protein
LPLKGKVSRCFDTTRNCDALLAQPNPVRRHEPVRVQQRQWFLAATTTVIKLQHAEKLRSMTSLSTQQNKQLFLSLFSLACERETERNRVFPNCKCNLQKHPTSIKTFFWLQATRAKRIFYPLTETKREPESE